MTYDPKFKLYDPLLNTSGRWLPKKKRKNFIRDWRMKKLDPITPEELERLKKEYEAKVS